MKICIFDVETTGLCPRTDRIVEIGIVTFKDLVVQGRYNKIVRPSKNSCYVPKDAERIHGISEKMIRDKGVLWKDIAGYVKSELESADYWCAYNAQFDISFIQNALRGVGMDLKMIAVVDPMRLAQRFIPRDKLKRKSLSHVAKFFDIELDRAHRACDDAAATGAIMKKFCEELDLTPAELVGTAPTKLGKWIMEDEYVDIFKSTFSCLPMKYHRRKK